MNGQYKLWWPVAYSLGYEIHPGTLVGTMDGEAQLIEVAADGSPRVRMLKRGEVRLMQKERVWIMVQEFESSINQEEREIM